MKFIIKAMNINENQWKLITPMKIKENQWKSMKITIHLCKINENQWKLLNTNENQQKVLQKAGQIAMTTLTLCHTPTYIYIYIYISQEYSATCQPPRAALGSRPRSRTGVLRQPRAKGSRGSGTLRNSNGALGGIHWFSLIFKSGSWFHWFSIV